MRCHSKALAAFLLLGSGPAFAGSQVGQITQVYTMDNGVVLFVMTGSRSGPTPSCGSGFPDRWALNGSTAAGQVKIASLLTAFSLKNTIYVYGKNSCVSWGDTEEVDFFNNVLP